MNAIVWGSRKTRTRFQRWRRTLSWPNAVRNAVGILALLVVWEFGAHSEVWFGIRVPLIGALPPPEAVLATWAKLIVSRAYWLDIELSSLRVLVGFGAAIVTGVPFGLLLALNRTFYGIAFPSFEVLRPIPAIAWVPASIIFWPSQDLSIEFVIFLGAFFVIVLNVIGGTRAIDNRYFDAARSMGSSSMDILRRIVLPGVVPSIVTGSVVGIAITWAVVIAGELISGGGGAANGSGSGIGFFIWNSYVTGGASSQSQIIVGMFTIGIAGYVSSGILRWIGRLLVPWQTVR